MVFVVTLGGEVRAQKRPPRARGTSNSNARGNSKARRARRQWLVDEFGNGRWVKCWKRGCKERLTVDTVTVDRIILGVDGGSYARNNIRPACAFHNSSEGSKARWARARASLSS